jgi:hypothetical protein|tara:strand:- start:3217 stop:3447 length:231 start_codon:yes stop_codon:yes gene_type:complete
MGNIIEFPMDRVRLTADAEDFFLNYGIALGKAWLADGIVQQSIDLEEETSRVLEQAKAIEEQSQRVLDLMTDLENY